MARFKRQSLEWREATEAMVCYPFEHLQKRMVRLFFFDIPFEGNTNGVNGFLQASGSVQPSLASLELEDLSKSIPDPMRETLIRNVAGISYAGILYW